MSAPDRLQNLLRREDERLERLDRRDREGMFGGGDWPDDEAAPAVRRSEMRPALHGSARRRRRWEKRARRESRRLRRRERKARRAEREAQLQIDNMKGEVKV